MPSPFGENAFGIRRTLVCVPSSSPISSCAINGGVKVPIRHQVILFFVSFANYLCKDNKKLRDIALDARFFVFLQEKTLNHVGYGKILGSYKH